MRRLLVGMAIMTLMSVQNAWAGDREIAEQIILQLKKQRDAGALKDFKVDLQVNDGIVAFTGTIASPKQRSVVLDTVKGVGGVANVLDKMRLKLPVVQPTAKKPQMIVAAPLPKPIENPAAKLVQKPAVKLATGLLPKAAPKVVSPETIKQPPVPTKLVGAVEPIKTSEKTSASPLVSAKIQRPKAIVIPSKVEVSQDDRDRELNSAITKALTSAKQNGRLRGFAMDITTTAGDVWLKGRTITKEQRDVVIDVVRRVPGVTNVVDDIEVMISKPAPQKPMVRQASDLAPVQKAVVQNVSQVPVPPKNLEPVPVRRAPARLVPVPYRRTGSPQPFAQAGVVMNGGPAMANQPMPMQMASAGGAYGAPRNSQPNLPNYAWPGYSAYPNYAALAYPKQYSPSAWPYIGPFYPYPQVPLNWRKVTLEWDDGWWQLDYSSKSR